MDIYGPKEIITVSENVDIFLKMDGFEDFADHGLEIGSKQSFEPM